MPSSHDDSSLLKDYRKTIGDWVTTRNIETFGSFQDYEYLRSHEKWMKMRSANAILSMKELLNGVDIDSMTGNQDLKEGVKQLMVEPWEVTAALVDWMSRNSDKDGDDFTTASDSSFNRMWGLLSSYRLAQTKGFKSQEALDKLIGKMSTSAKAPKSVKPRKKTRKKKVKGVQTTLDEHAPKKRKRKKGAGRPRIKPEKVLGKVESEGGPYSKGPPSRDRKERRKIDELISSGKLDNWSKYSSRQQADILMNIHLQLDYYDLHIFKSFGFIV